MSLSAPRDSLTGPPLTHPPTHTYTPLPSSKEDRLVLMPDKVKANLRAARRCLIFPPCTLKSGESAVLFSKKKMADYFSWFSQPGRNRVVLAQR